MSSSLDFVVSFSVHSLCLIAMTVIMAHFFVKMRKPSRQISKPLKFAAVSVLSFAWIAIACDVAINILDLLSLNHFAAYCYSIYCMRYIRMILFEMVLSVFWIIRLTHTFKYSALAIKLKIFIFIFVLILIVSAALSLFFILLLTDLEHANIYHTELHLAAMPANAHSCSIEWSAYILYLLLASQILILIQNIGFTALFWKQLRSLHAIVINSGDVSGQSGQRIRRIYQLQQKHTLLATIPILLTFIIYILFDLSNFYGYFSLYFLTNIDCISKALCMLLFFKFYQRRFGQICCCCIKCIGYANDELFPYFDPKQKINIYEAVKKANIKKQKLKNVQKAIKNGTLSAAEHVPQSSSDDEYNEDASRSFHEKNEFLSHLSAGHGKIGHAVVHSNDFESGDEHGLEVKFSAHDITPIDKIDPVQQQQATTWIQQVLNIEMESDSKEETTAINEKEDIFAQLHDGMLLCELLNAIKAGLCVGYKKSSVPFVQRQNIEIFISGCRELGLRDINIFDTNDLFEGQRLSAVLKCIFALSSKAKDIKEYNGPTIGYKFSERNERVFSVNTMNKTKNAIPFLNKPAIQMERPVIDSYGIIKVVQ